MLSDEKTNLFGTATRTALVAVVAALVLFCGSVAFALPKDDDAAGDSKALAAPSQEEASSASSSDSQESQLQANVTKSEMVYGMLAADGTLREMYVVNRFVSDVACTSHDYGAYSQVSNLTTTQQLECKDGRVVFDIGEEPFFYQGTLENVPLPWNVSLTYTLDDQVVAPEDLGGSSGRLTIEVTTSANPDVNPTFHECFMQQITFTLDGGLCSDIQAENATMAASGKDQTIAFTVLPGHDGNFKLSAQVKDFVMPSVQIAALPYSSVIEMPDTSEMEGGLANLSYAVSQLNYGTSELANGVAQLSSGAESLANGAVQFGDGLSQLASSSPQIVNASSQINDVLAQIANALKDVDFSNVEDIAKYSPVLRQIADALDTLKIVVQSLDDGYARMARVLEYLASIVYENPVSEDELAILREAVADDAKASLALEKLITSYYATLQAVNDFYASGGSPETIEAQLQAIFEDGGEIDQAVNALLTAADFLDGGGIGQIEQLITGLTELSSGYSQFHSGLVSYTQGVQTLNDNYGSLSSGMTQLASGTSQLANGASQLSDGIAQLNYATSDLPAQMRARMGELMADYEFPEFDPVSFVDERNENVTAVQFVMLTDAIEQPEPESAEPEPERELTIWERFLALFGM